MRRLSSFAVAVGLTLAAAQPAKADYVIYAFKGVLSAGETGGGFLSVPPGDLTGKPFEADFFRDENPPQGAEVIDQGFETGVSTQGQGVIPAVEGMMTVDGLPFGVFGTSAALQLQAIGATCGAAPQCFEFLLSDDDVLSVGPSFTFRRASFMEVFGLGDGILTSADYHSLGNLDSGAADITGGFSWSNELKDNATGEDVSSSYMWGGWNAATLTVTTVITSSPSAAPEPASWALMILGFGGVGAAFRRVRRRAAPAGRCAAAGG